jgi:hypothetical protein
VAEALEAVNKTEKREYEVELYRLKGELSLKSKVQGLKSKIEEEAETYFHKAVNIARHQQAQSWELRAATQPGPALAAPGQARRGLRTAGSHLRVVHRRF